MKDKKLSDVEREEIMQETIRTIYAAIGILSKHRKQLPDNVAMSYAVGLVTCHPDMMIDDETADSVMQMLGNEAMLIGMVEKMRWAIRDRGNAPSPDALAKLLKGLDGL